MSCSVDDARQADRQLWRALHEPLPRSTVTDPSMMLIGQSAAIRQTRAMVRRLARSGGGVVITGESGTGKELAARALHHASARRGGPFVAINCAAIPPQLLESELFGCARGAFTDAHRARTGLLVQANGGTVLLDEIASMPLELQAKLLRALESRRVRPLGQEPEIPFDVRVLAATHQDLREEALAGRFRHDLYYRLDVLELAMPPLRERGYDVLILARHFLQRCARRFDKGVQNLTLEAADRLMAYLWPGNVRELQNAMEAAVAVATHEHVLARDLPETVGPRGSGIPHPVEHEEMVPLATLRAAYIAFVERRTGENKTLAARTLGVDRKTLYRRKERDRASPDPRALRWIRRKYGEWGLGPELAIERGTAEAQ